MVATEHLDSVAVAASQGDREAFGKLWDTHHDLIARYIHYHVPNIDLCDELTAETCYRALRGIGQWDPTRGAIEAWLVVIARNVINQHFRYLQRHPVHDVPVEEHLRDRPERTTRTVWRLTG